MHLLVSELYKLIQQFGQYLHTMYIIFYETTNLKLVSGEVRVLKKGGENLFHFLDETTVANHDRSCASFS